MPSGSPTKDPEKAGVSNRNDLQLQNGSSGGQRYGLRNSTRHKDGGELRDTLTEGSDDDEADLRNIQSVKRKRNNPANRHVIDTEDEEEEERAARQRALKKRREERKSQASPEMDSDENIKMEVDSMDDELGIRRGTRVRRPNKRFNDYDLAARPKDQIKNGSVDSADEALTEANSGNNTDNTEDGDESKSRQAGPSPSDAHAPRKRGRPRKQLPPDDSDSMPSTANQSPSTDALTKIDGRKMRKRNPDGTFMKKEIKNEIITDDETVPQQDRSPRVSFQLPESQDREDESNSGYESSAENPNVVTRSRANAEQQAGSNSPPIRVTAKERGYATDSELCRTPTKRGPGRPRKYPLPTDQNDAGAQAVQTSSSPKNNIAQTVNMLNLQASTSRAVNTPRKQETPTSSANPRTPHRKNDVSAKECVQLLGPGYDLRRIMDELPNRKLRSGKEINTEDEASDNDEDVDGKAPKSAPEIDKKEEAKIVKLVKDTQEAKKDTPRSPQKETSSAQKIAEIVQPKSSKKMSPSQNKPKEKDPEPLEQQPRSLRNCSARSSKDKAENKSSSKAAVDIKKIPADNRKEAAKLNREKPKSTSKGKTTCTNTPSTTGSPVSSEDLEGMPTLERVSPSKGQASGIIGSEGEADEVPFSRRGTRSRAKEEKIPDDEMAEPPVLPRETYFNGPPVKLADTSGDGPPQLAQELDPYCEENFDVDSPPTLSPQRLQPINKSPRKLNDQPKPQSPARKSSPRKETLLRFNKDNVCNQPRTSRAAPSSPSKCQKKAGEDKKESEAAFSSKARQRLPAVQIARTRPIAKFELPPPPVLLQLQTIVQLPDTPESQSTPELLEAQNAEAISSPRRSPRKNSTRSPTKREANVNGERHNPKGTPGGMRSRETGETTPVDFATRKRRADDELIFAFNPLAKRYRSDTASSTTDEVPNSSSKSTASPCSNSSVTSSVTSFGRAHSRKAYTPKKVIEEAKETSPNEKENVIWQQFYNKRPEEYAKIFQTTVKMYKELADRGWRSFMRRNLGYVKAVLEEGVVSKYRIGEHVPPLVYEKKTVRVDPAISRHTRNKSLYLQKIIEKLTQKENSFEHVREKYGIDIYNEYSVGTLAKAEILEEQEPGKGRQYIYKQMGESEVGSSIPETLVDSVVFTSLRHQILPGKRVGWTDIFLAYEIKGNLSKLHPLKHITFPLWINENNKSTVDLLDQKYDEYDKLYIVTKVEITSNLASCKVKGHTLRSRNGGEGTSKVTYFPKHGEYPIEQVYWGAALFHEPEGVGYRLGSVNIELINRNALHIKNQQQKGFVQGLLNEIKKNNTNPFLVTEIKRRPINELSSSENEYYTDSDISLKSGSSGEAARCCGSHSRRNEDNAMEDSDEEDESRRGTAGISSRQLRKVISNVTLSALLGKVKPRKGRYINDKEMLKILFDDPRILHDNKKMSIINKWMPLAFPEKIKYRFLCYVQPKDEEEGESSEHSSGSASESKENKCTSIQFKKLDWFVTDQNDEPNRCIICGWQFSDVYSLMLHYNTTYPRLVFIFTIRDTMFEECRTASEARVVVDVMLEPRFQEIHELLPTIITDPIRRISSSRFLITRAVTNAMKAAMRRDNTIFARFLNVPEIVDETCQYVSRYVDTDSGLPMTISDEVDYVTTRVPNPGCQALHERLLRILQDFIDIDQVTKNFMSTWNKMVLTIGRYNQVILGPYMEHRLFINIFWDVMNTDSNWKKTFCTQLVEYGDCGTLNAEECHDLWQRVNDRDYNPLKDENSSLYRDLLDHLYKKNRTVRRNTRKQKIDISKKSAPYYRKNPRELDDDEMATALEYLYWNTKTIGKQDGRRLFMADPLENIPNNTKEYLKEFFRTLDHIDLREGEIDMYRT